MGGRWPIVRASAPDDAEGDLVTAAAAGDPAAQRRLFDREYPRVFATVSRLVGNRDVDDLVQDTFIAVFQALPSFRRDAKLATWIDRIAVNTVFMYMRSRKRTPVLVTVDEPVSPAAGRLVEQADAREGLRRLYATLNEMTPVARAAFALYAIDGRSINDIAALMGTSRVTAKLRIWRARREITRRADLDPVLAEFLEAHRQRKP